MTIRSWFHEQVIARAIAAAIWTIVLQAPLVLLLKLLCSGYESLWNCVALMLHFGSLISIVLIPLSVCGLTCAHLKYYLVEPVIFRTRWSFFRTILSPSFVLLVTSYGVIGGILVRSYFSTSTPFLGTLTIKCQDGTTLCLNESNVFGVLFGFWLGLGEGYDYFFSERRIIKLPHVYQYINVAVRAKMGSLSKNSFCTAAKKYASYLLLYYLLGKGVRYYLLAVTRLSIEDPLESLFSLFNPSLALRTILIGAASIFSIRLSNLLFNLYQLKPISFPVERINDDITPLLQEAIASEAGLLKLWASWDWRILAEQSLERRAIIFSVSQPGNHPHNWNSVISSILPQCLQFVSTLKGEEKIAKPEVTTLASVVQSPKPIELYSTAASPSRMRSMALPSPSKSGLEVEKPKPGVQERAYTKACELWENFKKKPIINFVWGELPDVKRRQTFAKAEPIILLVDGLSHFVSASYSEDKYGVVQKDLPEILTMFLELQQAIQQRGTSSGMLPKGTESSTYLPLDVQSKHKLKWAVKSSLYRVVVRFQRHILNVQLSPVHKQMIEQYLEFRVG